MKIIFILKGKIYIKKRSSYNTKQKDEILKIIRNYKEEFTIKDIYEKLNNEVGLTTIYRLVNSLINEGTIEKCVSKGNIIYYHYMKECHKKNHFYLKCDNCKKLVHIDCDCIEELSSHIFKKHKFKPNKDHIIFNGICEKCIKNEKNKV